MRLQSAIQSFLDQEQISDANTHTKPETGYFSAGFYASLAADQYEIYVDSHEHTQNLKVYAYAPFLVPEEKRQAVAELVCRINRSLLRMGAIDLCLDTGSLRFRHGLLLEGVDVTVQMIDNIVREGLATLDYVLPMVEQVVAAVPCLDAIQQQGSNTVTRQCDATV